MAMGRRQGDLMVGWAEMPRSPGHVFYDRLHGADRGRLRRLRGELPALLRGQDGRALGAARRYFRCTWCYFASTQSAVWSGVARPCRCGTSRLGSRERVRTIPGCRRPARACPMKSTRRSSTGFWP